MAFPAVTEEELEALRGNGTFRLGYVDSTDVGLPRADYVVIKLASMQPTESINVVDEFDPAVFSKILSILGSDAHLNQIGNEGLRHWVRLNRAVAGAFGWFECNGSIGVTGEVEYIEGNHEEDATAYTSCPEFEMLKRVKFQSASLASALCALNYFTTNHNTTGLTLPSAHEKAVRSASGCGSVVSSKDICSAVYLAGHATSKRITLKFLGKKLLTESLLNVKTCNEVYVPEADSWYGLRINGFPAGTAILSTAIVITRYLAKTGLAGYKPIPMMIKLCSEGLQALKGESFRFHPGCQYLCGTASSTLTMIADLKEHVGEVGGFFIYSGLLKSVFQAPHIKMLHDQYGSAAWDQLGHKLAKGVDMEINEAVAVMTKMGLNTSDDVPKMDSDEYPAWCLEQEAALTRMLQDVDKVHPESSSAKRVADSAGPTSKKSKAATTVVH